MSDWLVYSLWTVSIVANVAVLLYIKLSADARMDKLERRLQSMHNVAFSNLSEHATRIRWLEQGKMPPSEEALADIRKKRGYTTPWQELEDTNGG